MMPYYYMITPRHTLLEQPTSIGRSSDGYHAGGELELLPAMPR